MRQIISVSRRTDIPAFYGEWFLNRIKEGFCGYINPFGQQRYIVPLKPEKVICFVFWSKDYTPFLPCLDEINKMGYKAYFNFTLTGLPAEFEENICSQETAIMTMKTLSAMYSPEHINWRYDPIILSDKTPYDYHIMKFKELVSTLKEYVTRCYISFATLYDKVKKNFELLKMKHAINIIDPDMEERLRLAANLAEIALNNGIRMYTCCGDYLISDTIYKAHCIDGAVIEKLFYPEGFPYKEKPTRKQCGCTASRDIGIYDSCPHGCIYCYANINKERAREIFKTHDPGAAFLGFSRDQSAVWIKEIQEKEKEPDLFNQ